MISWEKTLYGFQRASGHALLAPWVEQSAVEVSFELRGFDGQYDQAGLMLWTSSSQWIKAGVEINDGVPSVGAVVTDEYSDWSLAPVPEWQGSTVTIRASRSNGCRDHSGNRHGSILADDSRCSLRFWADRRSRSFRFALQSARAWRCASPVGASPKLIRSCTGILLRPMSAPQVRRLTGKGGR